MGRKLGPGEMDQATKAMCLKENDMVKESTKELEVGNTRENWDSTSEKEEVSKDSLMGHYMTGTGKTIKLKVKEKSLMVKEIKKETHTLEIGILIRSMDMVCTNGQMDECMKVIGSRTLDMGGEFTPGQMVRDTKDSIKWTKEKELERTIGKTVGSTEELGKQAINKARENSFCLQATPMKDIFIKTKDMGLESNSQPLVAW